MKFSHFICTLLCIASLSSQGFGADEGFYETDGPYVRVIKHEDGSRSIFKKIPNQKGMQKRTYNAEGVLICVTQYATGKWGELTSCKIYDGKKNELFKVAYGYDKKTARLMVEDMFDSKTNQPVRRFIYTYDDAGNRGKPICINLVTGTKDSRNHGTVGGPSAPEKDPFADDDKDKKSSKSPTPKVKR